jgi:pimeloyl-ACP methyl ester carboxylesterase
MHLNYELIDGGHEQWMVFVHGAGGNIRTWRYQREAFAHHYNLLLIDLRDHGESSQESNSKQKYSFEIIAQDVLNMMDRLGIDKAIFVALSMGSLIIQKISEIRASAIDKAIIAGGIFDITTLIRLFAGSATFFSYVIPFRWSYWMFSYLLMPRKNHQRARKIFIRQAKKLSPAAYRRWIGLYKEFHVMVKRYNSTNLTYPLLAVMGGEDYMFLDPAKRFVDQQLKAHLMVIPNCGHICNIERAEEFNRMALDWAKKINLKSEI